MFEGCVSFRKGFCQHEISNIQRFITSVLYSLWQPVGKDGMNMGVLFVFVEVAAFHLNRQDLPLLANRTLQISQHFNPY